MPGTNYPGRHLMLHTSGAPSAPPIILPNADPNELLMAAIRKYLEGGATLTKDAPLKARAYRQFTIGAKVPTFIQGQTDNHNQAPYVPPGSYIALIIPESPIRFSNDGSAIDSGYGVPLIANQSLYITSQEIETFQAIAQSGTALLNVEYYQVDA